MHAHEELPGQKTASTGRTPHPSTAASGDAVRGPMTPHAALALQRSIGNRAASRVLGGHVQRRARPVDDTTPATQREYLDAALASDSHRLTGAMGEDAERFFQNPALRSATAIHDNPVGHAAAEAMGAQAFTYGTHVVLGKDAGKNPEIVYHELGHVDKNTRGMPETGHDHGGGVSLTDRNQTSEQVAAADGRAKAQGARIAPSVATVSGGAPETAPDL